MATNNSIRPNHQASRNRVLIVDDHPIVRCGLKKLIEREGDLLVCAEAEGMPQALREFRQTSPNLVITDVTLQNGSGIELIKELVAQRAQVRILVCSMHDETLFAQRALRAGAKGFVNKSAEPDQMILAIRRVLDGGVHLSEQMTDRILCRKNGNGSPAACLSSVECLSDRELEVFQQIGRAITTQQVAQRLHLSPKTIETYREHIKTKLGLSNSSQLSQRAIQWVLESC